MTTLRDAAFRAHDLLLASLALLVLAVPMLAIALALCLSGLRPALFTQARPGRDGRLFRLIKFRSMTDDTDDHGVLLSDEARLTRLGAFLRRTSLDETPSLWNVLKGDMAIVGPRPLLPEYLPHYSPSQARRHMVRPGLTGWAQVNGRNAISWEERFVLDVWYVDNRSLALDWRIIVMTVLKVITRDGISAEGYATMPDFTGSPLEADARKQ